jgi:hypothetical protein
MANPVNYIQESADVTLPYKIRTHSECLRIGRFVEPCTIAPCANPKKPQPPKDWETPENLEPLWEQELHRTNGGDSRSVAWLSLYYGCDGNRERHEDDAPCRFVVVFNDLLTRNEDGANDGRWHHDITSTPLGQFILEAWISLDPEKHANLPKNYKEWYERGRRRAFEDTAADVKETGIDVTGMSEEEVYACWEKILRQRRPAELESQGYSPEQIAQQMLDEFGECQ